MPVSALSELVAGKSEDLGVEYKAWMDTSQPEVRAKLARHIAALSNEPRSRRRALLRSVRPRRQNCRLHAGHQFGEIDGPPAGDRLQQLGRTVLLSRVFADLVEGDFDLEHVGEHPVRGFNEPIELFAFDG
jgi:class 3 adenylate cyclase